MGLFRRAPRPDPVPLVLPLLDGTGWPAAAGRASFEASTYAEMAGRRAHDPDARGLADRLLEACTPLLPVQVSPQDAPYLRKTWSTAARLGAALGLVDREAVASPAGTLDDGVAGALGLARRGLPPMQDDWSRITTWLLLAAHWLARQEPDRREAAVRELQDALLDRPLGRP